MRGAALASDAELRGRIEDLLNDCAHAIDDGEFERWPEFFAEDASYKVITRENFDAGLPMGIMYCEGRGMMSDRVMALRTANIYEPHTYCHIHGRTRLVDCDETGVHARTNFTVIRTMQDGRMEIYAAGKYVDILADDGGRLLLRDRQVVLESRRVDILLVFPI